MTNTINNVPRELLERHLNTIEHHLALTLEGELARSVSEIRTLLSAPSPAGAGGLEVRAYERKWSSDNIKPEKRVNENGRKEWPFKFKLIPVTQRPCLPDDEPLCRLSDAQAIIDGLRGEVDQQAQRIGELASHLEFAVTMLTVAGLAGNAQVEAMHSALSAGHEPKQCT